jgi:hypothetical protein
MDRMIIANINLGLSVEDVLAASRSVESIAERYGGFVSNANVRNSDKAREGTITVRVPHQRLTEALADLRGVGQKVIDESRGTEDVTEEYTDVESNLRNLRATETQLIGIMEKSTRIEDVLRVQREVTSIRGQIERLEGRRRALENRSDLATITMRLIEGASPNPRTGWNGAEVAAQAIAALGVIGQQLATLLIWLVVFAPMWAIPAGLIWWVASRNRALRPPGAEAS